MSVELVDIYIVPGVVNCIYTCQILVFQGDENGFLRLTQRTSNIHSKPLIDVSTIETLKNCSQCSLANHPQDANLRLKKVIHISISTHKVLLLDVGKV